MSSFAFVEGIVTEIEPAVTAPDNKSGCMIRMTVSKKGDVTNFMVDPATYFLNNVTIRKGDRVQAFYDTSAPTVMIYPPQYRAVFVARIIANDRQITLDYFDSNLVSSDGSLKLNISPRTRQFTTNSQVFLGNPENHYLAVVYTRSTKSIPAMTTPLEIIVFCTQ